MVWVKSWVLSLTNGRDFSVCSSHRFSHFCFLILPVFSLGNISGWINVAMSHNSFSACEWVAISVAHKLSWFGFVLGKQCFVGNRLKLAHLIDAIQGRDDFIQLLKHVTEVPGFADFV